MNGAGKTTTFEMLTGRSFPDSGHAYINGLSVLKTRVCFVFMGVIRYVNCTEQAKKPSYMQYIFLKFCLL